MCLVPCVKEFPPWAIKDEPKEIDSTERQPFNLALLTKTNAEPGGLLAQSADSALQARLKRVPLEPPPFSSLRAMRFSFFKLPAQIPTSGC